jgi:hypothetical protein
MLSLLGRLVTRALAVGGKDTSSGALVALPITGGKVDVNATIGSVSADGALVDGVDDTIRSTVLDLASANPLAVAIVDATGAQISSFATSSATAATSTLTNVPENASNVTLLAANSNRLGGSIENDSDGILKVKAGATATATSYSRTMLPRESRTLAELFGGEYVGKIDGIWLSAPGTSGHTAARCTELEA